MFFFCTYIHTHVHARVRIAGRSISLQYDLGQFVLSLWLRNFWPVSKHHSIQQCVGFKYEFLLKKKDASNFSHISQSSYKTVYKANIVVSLQNLNVIPKKKKWNKIEKNGTEKTWHFASYITYAIWSTAIHHRTLLNTKWNWKLILKKKQYSSFLQLSISVPFFPVFVIG